MTYLSRPVWTFPTDWSQGPAQEWAYDLREVQLGFGSPDFGPLQRHVVRGWTLSIWLDSPADIAAFESFLDSTQGRTTGFWLPAQQVISTIAAGASTTQFDVRSVGLADTWSDDACTHLLLTAPDGTQTAVAITAAATVGDVDRLTVSPALPSTPARTWSVHRLLYVRLTDDNEAAEVVAEGRQRRSVRVVELPEEYSAAVTGQSPVFLYRFFQVIEGVEQSWRYTSFAEAITSGGETFAPMNLTHGTILRSTRADREEVTVDTMLRANAPWGLSLPAPSQWPLWVEILQAEFADPDATTVLFTGRESGSPRFEGRRVRMRFASWLDSLDARVPHMLFGPRCPYALFDSRTCGVDPAPHEMTGTIDLITGLQLILSDLSGTPTANQFAGGVLYTGSGADREVRTIMTSTAIDTDGRMALTLSAPIRRAVATDGVTLRPGCNKTFDDCVTRYANNRFGGTPFVPRTNLAVKAVEIEGTGEKK